jgi:outer membrane protein assembly factor BamA
MEALNSHEHSLPFSQAEHRRQFPIEDGEIFDAESIRRGLENLQRLYTSHGYINFTAVPDTVCNDERSTVTLGIVLDAGAQFQFGTLELVGFGAQPDTLRQINASWHKHEGQIYDVAVVESLWSQVSSLYPPGSSMWGFLELRQSLDAPVVDLRLRLPSSR